MSVEFIGMIGTREASELHGFDPMEDAIAYGRDVISLVRQEVQQQERPTATVA